MKNPTNLEAQDVSNQPAVRSITTEDMKDIEEIPSHSSVSSVVNTAMETIEPAQGKLEARSLSRTPVP
jgi:hypothetical protein